MLTSQSDEEPVVWAHFHATIHTHRQKHKDTITKAVFAILITYSN